MIRPIDDFRLSTTPTASSVACSAPSEKNTPSASVTDSVAEYLLPLVVDATGMVRTRTSHCRGPECAELICRQAIGDEPDREYRLQRAL